MKKVGDPWLRALNDFTGDVGYGSRGEVGVGGRVGV